MVPRGPQAFTYIGLPPYLGLRACHDVPVSSAVFLQVWVCARTLYDSCVTQQISSPVLQ